jgi:hypothetical protein
MGVSFRLTYLSLVANKRSTNAQPSVSLTPGIFHNVRDINQVAVSATKALHSGEKKRRQNGGIAVISID